MQPEVSVWLSSCSSTANSTSVKETGRNGIILHMHAEECLQIAMCVLLHCLFRVCVCACDVTASLPWAGMTPGCSEHNIHIN